MTYAHPAHVKSNRIVTRSNDQDYAIFSAWADLSHKAKAVAMRDLAMAEVRRRIENGELPQELIDQHYEAITKCKKFKADKNNKNKPCNVVPIPTPAEK